MQTLRCLQLLTIALGVLGSSFFPGQRHESSDVQPLGLPALGRRDATICDNSSHVTPSGLRFDVYCNSVLGYSQTTSTEDDVYACMNKCGENFNCYGITYTPANKTCALGGSDFPSSLSNTVSNADQVTHSAIVSPTSQITTGYNTDCGYVNGSTHTTYNGMPFTVTCGIDLVGGDLCPTGNGSCPGHVTSFEECINQCAQSHPLCWGVSWAPDAKLGWPNCFLKSARPMSKTTAYINGEEDFIVHNAQVYVQNGTDVRYNCTDQELFSSNTKQFRASCNTDQSGTNLWSQHEDSMQGCVDACATYSGNTPCVAVGWDSQLQNGWQNCYLKGAANTPTTGINITLALLIKNITTSATQVAGGTSIHNTSNAWIAGVVVGILVVVSALVGAFIMFRRRQRQQANASHETNTERYEKAELGNNEMNDANASYDVPVEISTTEAPAELPARTTRAELAG